LILFYILLEKKGAFGTPKYYIILYYIILYYIILYYIILLGCPKCAFFFPGECKTGSKWWKQKWLPPNHEAVDRKGPKNMRSKRFQGKLYLKTAEKIRNEISRKLLSKNASINGRFCKQAHETAFISLNLSSFPSFADGAWLQLGSQHRTWQTEIKTWGAPTVSRHFASCKSDLRMSEEASWH